MPRRRRPRRSRSLALESAGRPPVSPVLPGRLPRSGDVHREPVAHCGTVSVEHDHRAWLDEPVSGVANNLPAQLTAFIGRERELDELRSLITSSRILTLNGT